MSPLVQKFDNLYGYRKYGHAHRVNGKMQRLNSLVPRLPLSPLLFSFFFLNFRACKYYTQKIDGEGEPGTELRLPVATLASHGHGHDSHDGHALHCAQYCSWAASWIMINFAKRSLQSRPVKFFLLGARSLLKMATMANVINKEV